MCKEYKICQYNIREVQNKLLVILLEVDRICRKYDIKYTIEGGTLLGAIKYKGFVPWDDDIDIVMLRDHYERFLFLCKTELKSNFFLQNSKSKKEYTLQYSKLCMNHTLYVQENSKHLNIHHGLFIDIFPIDNINIKTFKYHLACIRGISGAIDYKVNKKYSVNKLKSKNFLKNLLCKSLSHLSFTRLNKISYNLMTYYNKKRTSHIFELCTGKITVNPLERYIYEELIEVEFMGEMVFATKHYNEFLYSRFGDINKLPPIDKRVPSHNIIKCKL